jgi:hypothetical protein
MSTMMKKHWTLKGKRPLSRGARIAGMAVLGVAAAAVFALVFGILVMLLWNWLMPLIFGLREITYWQAFGLVILVKLIFGTIGKHSRRDNHFHERWKRRDFENDDWEQQRDPEKWRHWPDFWRDEGREAFERYVHHWAPRSRDGGEPGADEDNGT